MSNVYDFPAKKEKQYDEASLWIAKLDRGLLQKEEIELRSWLTADPDNKELLLSMAGLWDKMGVLARLSNLFPNTTSRRSALNWTSVSLAASVLLVVVTGIWIGTLYGPLSTSNSEQQASVSLPASSLSSTSARTTDAMYETAVGEQSTVILTDGTEVVLNTNSMIEVQYFSDRRLLSLERGEIHIEVAEDKSRPLTVIAGENLIQAVGTAFSLEINSDQQVELVVTEGRVLVGIHHPSTTRVPEEPPLLLPPTSRMIAAGEEFLLGSENEEVVVVSPEEIEVKLSWREGNLIFRGESLEEALTEIGRYTTVEFVISDEDLKFKTIGGRFRAGDVDGLLATLRENFSISYERTEDGRILLSSL